MAGAAPLRPEVDEHGLVALEDLISKVASVTSIAIAFLSVCSLADYPTSNDERAHHSLPDGRPSFQPLPTVPDHAALEQEILTWWERQGIFEQAP